MIKNLFKQYCALYALFVSSEKVQFLQLGKELSGNGNWSVSSISSEGMSLVIGTPQIHKNGVLNGSVQVYDYDGSQWIQVGADIEGETSLFGTSVAISANGRIVAIGAPWGHMMHFGLGQVRVYYYDGFQWSQMGGDLNGGDAGRQFGKSVSISSNGMIVAVGEPWSGNGGGSKSGQVRVYTFNESKSKWITLGSNIHGTGRHAFFGRSLSMSSDGMIVALGGRSKVKVYRYVAEQYQWSQMGGDLIGTSNSISADGMILAIGKNGGNVKTYLYDGTQWEQMGSNIDVDSSDSLSISPDGTSIAIGAPYDIGNGSFSGHVRVYSYNGSQWIQMGNDLVGNAGDLFGKSVSIAKQGTELAVLISQDDGTVRIIYIYAPTLGLLQPRN